MTTDDTTAHIHLKVDQTRKDKWQEHAGQRADISTLSSLIRMSVEKEIAGEYDEAEKKYSELIDVMSEIQSQHQTILQNQKSIEDETIEIGQIENIANAILDRIDDLENDGGTE